MKKITRIALGVAVGLLTPAIAFATFSSDFQTRLSQALHSSSLGAHVKVLLDREELQPSSSDSAWTITACNGSFQRDLTLQLKDSSALGAVGGASASAVTNPRALFCYLSNASTGVGFAGAVTSLAGMGNGAVQSLVTGVAAEAVADSSGDFTIRSTTGSCGATVRYAVCVGPDQKPIVSASFTQ